MDANRVKALNEAARLIKQGQPIMGLQEWDIKAQAAPTDMQGAQNEGTLMASTCADPVYLNAKITIYPAWWAQDSQKRKSDIFHELAHCLTQEVWDALANQRGNRFYGHQDQREIIERLTTRIANIPTRGMKK